MEGKRRGMYWSCWKESRVIGKARRFVEESGDEGSGGGV